MIMIEDKFIKLIKERFGNQKKFCETTGSPTSTINRWIKHGFPKPIKDFIQIIQVLEISLDDLLVKEIKASYTIPCKADKICKQICDICIKLLPKEKDEVLNNVKYKFKQHKSKPPKLIEGQGEKKETKVKTD